MKRRIIYLILALGILTGGTFFLTAISRHSGGVGDTLSQGTFLWDGLPVTPPANGALCPAPPEGNWATWDQMKEESPSVVTGIAAGNLRGNFRSIGYWTFESAPETPLQTHFNVWYPKTDQNTDPLPIRVIVLLDDVQLFDVVSTNTANLASTDGYYDVRLAPDDDREFTLNLEPLEPGIHDLLILLFRNIDGDPDNRGHISVGDMRLTIFVPGGSDQVQRQFHTRLEPIKYRAPGASGLGLVASLSAEGPSTWNWPQNTFPVPANQDTLKFYSWFGYLFTTNKTNPNIDITTPDHDQPIRLFVFFDYVLSDQEISQPVNDILLPSNSELSVLQHVLKIPRAPGQHDILIVRLNYPGVPVCRLQGGREGISFADAAHIQRVAIIVP